MKVKEESEKAGLKITIQKTKIMAAAAAAKLLQLCPTLCNPIDGSPPGSPIPEILQARVLEWGAISFSNAWKWKVKVKSLSHVWLFTTPWTAVYQAPPSMGFSRQEYWSGVPLPSLKIMASSPITLWQIDRGKWKQWQILFSWAPKSLWIVTAATKLKDASSLEEKLWPNLGSILLTKVHIVKAMVYPAVMYGCESWTIKKAEHWRIDAFELWY